LIIFVQNGNLTNIVNNVKAATKEHKYYVSSNEVSKETSFSFKFHHPDDSKRLIDLEIMLFHFVRN
jgi:hypothetical protein